MSEGPEVPHALSLSLSLSLPHTHTHTHTHTESHTQRISQTHPLLISSKHQRGRGLTRLQEAVPGLLLPGRGKG